MQNYTVRSEIKSSPYYPPADIKIPTSFYHHAILYLTLPFQILTFFFAWRYSNLYTLLPMAKLYHIMQRKKRSLTPMDKFYPVAAIH